MMTEPKCLCRVKTTPGEKCLCRVKTTPGEFGGVMVEIQYCPMHKAAPELKSELERIVTWLIPDLIEDTKAYGEQARLDQIGQYLKTALAVLAKAEKSL